MAWTQKQLEDLIKRHDAWLLSQPGVVAAGVALGSEMTPCLEISTDGITRETRLLIESRLKDAPLVFTRTGPINAQ